MIRAPPERIWRYVTDFPRLPEWYRAAREVVVTTPGSRGVGTTMRCTFLLRGHIYEFEQMIVTWDPPWHATVRQTRGSMKHFGASIDLILQGEATQLTLTLQYAFRIPLLSYIINAFLLRRAVEADMRQALANLRQLVESSVQAGRDIQTTMIRTESRGHHTH